MLNLNHCISVLNPVFNPFPCTFYLTLISPLFSKVPNKLIRIIDLFTDTAAILNLIDLRSIMGCPGGTRSVFTRGFWAKRELNVYFTTHGKLYSRRRTVRFIANFLSCWACSASRVTCRRTIFSYLASHGSCTDPYKQKLSIMKEL